MTVFRTGNDVRVEWSDEALTDRAAIVDYLLPRNPHATKRIVLQLIDTTADLAMFPKIGREGEDGTREWVIVHPYVEVNEIESIVKISRI
ncbi:type II toxin-antitoxin system RelE/ParE family toxin [Acetobacter cibinongensis]|uniref:type II toxin-antitoxin system RelE/ParE family toxin n=1 Tax=Acetobacter cibinongensis TaxID=146475 RepID=UPI001F0B1ED9|nr:type II toxin-antitoxin system RelE/ParE family toxin [Acetobacter cibinongensis]